VTLSRKMSTEDVVTAHSETTSDAIVEGAECKSDDQIQAAIETKVDHTVQANNVTRHWDHSIRKVVVRNLFKFIKPKDLQKLMNSWTDGTSMKIVKHKRAPKVNWILLTLEHEDMVEPFLKLFEGGKQRNKKGGKMHAHRAKNDDGNEDENNKKRKNSDQKDGREKKARTALEDCIKTPDQVRDKLTPFWKLSYEEQLKQKTRNIINKCLSKIITEMKFKFRTLNKEMRKSNGCRKVVDPMYGWIKDSKGIKVEKILGAPAKYEYRNKSELTFGYAHKYEDKITDDVDVTGATKENVKIEVTDNNEDMRDTKDITMNETEAVPLKKKIIKTPAVGFMAAGWSGGVSEPHCLQNIPDTVCGITDIVNKFLQDSSVPPYNSRVHQGIWRTLTIRTSERTKECMVIILHAPSTGGVGKRDDGSDDYSHIFESEKERLIKMLTTGCIPKPTRNYPSSNDEMEIDGKDKSIQTNISVTSVLFQEYDGLSNPPPEHPIQHAYGKEFLEERLLQCQFQISPGAFFQVTTEGAEVLYKVVVDKVKEVTEKPKETLLFDVCCGTGTIGLTCLKEGAVGKVVGIDISEPAIKDAMANVARNEFPVDGDVTKFVASRAEKVMNNEIREVGDCPIVAVVDPAREGLHQDVCRALRNERNIQRIVYVSCNPTGSLIKDTVMLCCPKTKKYTGRPFKPTSAQPVDMFPQTSHCELVIVFDRMSKHECEGGYGTDEENDKNDVEAITEENGKDHMADEGEDVNKDVAPIKERDGKEDVNEGEGGVKNFVMEKGEDDKEGGKDDKENVATHEGKR